MKRDWSLAVGARRGSPLDRDARNVGAAKAHEGIIYKRQPFGRTRAERRRVNRGDRVWVDQPHCHSPGSEATRHC